MQARIKEPIQYGSKGQRTNGKSKFINGEKQLLKLALQRKYKDEGRIIKIT